jgi:glutaredoxin
MRFAIAASVATALLASALVVEAQQLYRWTDEKGRVHISDTPPPPGARNVQKRGAGGANTAAAPSGAEPYALQVARKSFPITLYSTPGCEACDLARKLLNARGVPFKEVSVGDEGSIEELKKVAGSASVPTMVVGSTVQKGYESGTYHRVLDAAGYPKTGVLPPRSQAEPRPVQPAAPEVQPAAPAPQPSAGPYTPTPPREEPQARQ